MRPGWDSERLLIRGRKRSRPAPKKVHSACGTVNSSGWGGGSCACVRPEIPRIRSGAASDAIHLIFINSSPSGVFSPRKPPYIYVNANTGKLQELLSLYRLGFSGGFV